MPIDKSVVRGVDVHGDGDLIVVPPATWTGHIRVQARLWYEDTGEPSPLFGIVGDDLPPTSGPNKWGDKVKQGDLARFDLTLQKIMDRAGMTLDDYAATQHRTAMCDLLLPRALINGYTG